jgi:hypothetical protein
MARTLNRARGAPGVIVKIIFWSLVAVDLLGVGLIFLLGLAAAGSSRTSTLQVAVVLLVLPVTLLSVAVLVFVKAGSAPMRLLAFLIAATPLAAAFSARAIAQIQFRTSLNAAGEMTFYRAGPLREMAEAISRNDSATVAALATKVEINRTGSAGMTLLGIAMRQLRRTPKQQEVLRILLDAGANPNQEAQSELPLSVAIQVSGEAGPGPVRLLLDAGANPNLADSFGSPVYFVATGVSADLEALALLIDRGADINAVTRAGTTALFSAAMTRNWPAALLLLRRGADWKVGKSANGLDFRTLVESQANLPDESGLAEVRDFLRQR